MLSDWESSLTELSSDEDTYAPAPKKAKTKTKAKAKAKAKEEYKVSGALSLMTSFVADVRQVTNLLQPYRTTTYTAQSLYGTSFPAKLGRDRSRENIDQIVDNTVQLDPEYQRGM